MVNLYRLFKHIRPFMVAIVVLSAVAGGLVGLALADEAAAPAEPAAEEADAPEAPAAEAPAEEADAPEAPAAEAPAQEDEGEPTEADGCATCHAEVVEAWTGGPHAMAYQDELFQEKWAEQDNDPTCLECHTTGYVPATGEYAQEGVSCTACHGEASEGHPPAPVDTNRANETCQDCHTVTHAEYRVSKHSAIGMECTSCHYAHSNGLRMETEVQQCLNCHNHQLDDFAHASHIDAGLTCRDCHGYVRPDGEMPIDGQYPTGHDFAESLTACLDCHEDIQLEPLNGEEVEHQFDSSEVGEIIAGGREAELRILELENIAETLEVQSRNCAGTRVLQGAAGGILIGGVVVLVISQLRPQLKSEGGEATEDHDEE